MMGARWSRRLLLSGLVALALGAGGCEESGLPVLPIGGDFALTDHDSVPFELASVRGKVVLIFFGYSMCPDVCPTTLSKLSSVSRQLGDVAVNLKTLYITVDPERDTPAALKADLASFGLDATGLTGSRAAIDTVVALYGASYQIVPTPESAAGYSVSHTTRLYALDQDGRVRMTFPYEATVDEIVLGIRAILAEGP